MVFQRRGQREFLARETFDKIIRMLSQSPLDASRFVWAKISPNTDGVSSSPGLEHKTMMVILTMIVIF